MALLADPRRSDSELIDLELIVAALARRASFSVGYDELEEVLALRQADRLEVTFLTTSSGEVMVRAGVRTDPRADRVAEVLRRSGASPTDAEELAATIVAELDR